MTDALCSRSELRSYKGISRSRGLVLRASTANRGFRSILIRWFYPDRSDLFSVDYQSLVPVMNFWKGKCTLSRCLQALAAAAALVQRARIPLFHAPLFPT